MEPKTHIKQHDFISGEPRHKYFVLGNYDWSNIKIRPTNCDEISLAGVGKTGMFQRMIEALRDNRQVVNSDYESLYPYIYHTLPVGHVSRPDEVNPNMPLRDFIELKRRQQQEVERMLREQTDFINKLILNNF